MDFGASRSIILERKGCAKSFLDIDCGDARCRARFNIPLERRNATTRFHQGSRRRSGGMASDELALPMGGGKTSPISAVDVARAWQ
jgi:hypothetical protein